MTHIAVAFDNPIRSFRNDLFPYYKSDEGVPPELRAQFDAVEEAVRAIGVAVWSMKEYEADDGLATGARRFATGRAGPDHDARQGPGAMYFGRTRRPGRSASTKGHRRGAFRALRGFGPKSMPDFLALTGDTADGIPGLPGFGEKGASMLIGAYEHLENIPDSCGPVEGQAARRAEPRGDASPSTAKRRSSIASSPRSSKRSPSRDARRPSLPRRPRALRSVVRSLGATTLRRCPDAGRRLKILEEEDVWQKFRFALLILRLRKVGAWPGSAESR